MIMISGTPAGIFRSATWPAGSGESKRESARVRRNHLSILKRLLIGFIELDWQQ